MYRDRDVLISHGARQPAGDGGALLDHSGKRLAECFVQGARAVGISGSRNSRASLCPGGKLTL